MIINNNSETAPYIQIFIPNERLIIFRETPGVFIKKMKSANTPWHVADLDGRLVVRDANNDILFEHAAMFTKEEKLRNSLLVKAAPEMLLSLCEMVLLLDDVAGSIKLFKTTNGDVARAVARAKAAIKSSNENTTKTVSW